MINKNYIDHMFRGLSGVVFAHRQQACVSDPKADSARWKDIGNFSGAAASYNTIGMQMPRQCGKTTFIQSHMDVNDVLLTLNGWHVDDFQRGMMERFGKRFWRDDAEKTCMFRDHTGSRVRTMRTQPFCTPAQKMYHDGTVTFDTPMVLWVDEVTEADLSRYLQELSVRVSYDGLHPTNLLIVRLFT